MSEPITGNEIKETVEHPDKVMICGGSCDKSFYIKKFRSKGELLVMVETINDDQKEVTCFGWIENVFYPSY